MCCGRRVVTCEQRPSRPSRADAAAATRSHQNVLDAISCIKSNDRTVITITVRSLLLVVQARVSRVSVATRTLPVHPLRKYTGIMFKEGGRVCGGIAREGCVIGERRKNPVVGYFLRC